MHLPICFMQMRKELGEAIQDLEAALLSMKKARLINSLNLQVSKPGPCSHDDAWDCMRLPAILLAVSIDGWRTMLFTAIDGHMWSRPYLCLCYVSIIPITPVLEGCPIFLLFSQNDPTMSTESHNPQNRCDLSIDSN